MRYSPGCFRHPSRAASHGGADAVSAYMRVPMGAGNSVPWDPDLASYVIEPMNCRASRQYDAMVFVGPARTGKTIGPIDGWIVYNVVCDRQTCSLFRFQKKRRVNIRKSVRTALFAAVLKLKPD